MSSSNVFDWQSVNVSNMLPTGVYITCLTCILTCLPCRWSTQHCEIAGWGMQEYNNTNSYPDSVRAAKITVLFTPDTEDCC